MIQDELIAAAMHAALLEDLYPCTDLHPPQVTRGPKAATVLMADHNREWIVAIRLNDAVHGQWHVTGPLPPGSARAAAHTYAHAGL